MEPDLISPEQATLGMAVLSAIPVVLFALWADSFNRYLDHLAIKRPQFDRAAEMQRVRVASLLALGFQLLLFMGTSDLRHLRPILGNGILILAVLAQGAIQLNLERKLKSSEPPKPAEALEVATKAFFWATVGAALYICVTVVTVKIFSVAAQLLHLGSGPATACVIFGGVVGVLGGLGLNFALAPMHLRHMLPVRRLEDATLTALFSKCFYSADLNPPDFWVIEMERGAVGTAMIAGFRFGRGIFKQGLFVSRATIQALSPEELRAVVLHEVSHIRLSHLRKRIGLTFGLVVATTFVATLLYFLVAIGLKLPGSNVLFGPLTGFAAFMMAFKVLGRQNRKHELEADIHSIEALHSKLDDLEGALRKLNQVNDEPLNQTNPMAFMSGLGHLAVEKRIRLIRLYFAAKQARAESLKASARNQETKKAA